MDNTLKEQEQKLIENLLIVKEDYQKTKEQLALSIRKDVLLVELKDIIIQNKDYESLKNSLEYYIKNLEGEINGKN